MQKKKFPYSYTLPCIYPLVNLIRFAYAKKKKCWHLIVILWQGAYELNLDFSALHKYKQEVKKANFTIGVAGIAGTLYYRVP